MQLPMEFLSNMTTRTGSGAEFGRTGMIDTRGSPRTSPQAQVNSRFAREINRAQEALNNGNGNGSNNSNRLTTEEPEDPRTDPRYTLPPMHLAPDEKPDETLAAGATDPNMIVSILEGDKESATTPLAQDYAAQPTEEKPEQLTTDMKTEPIKLTEDEAALLKKEANIAQQTADAEKPEVKPQSEIAAQAGEVTARKPSTGISEQKIDTGNNSKSSENGILSPLENENDTAPIKEQPQQSLSDMTEGKSRSKEDTSESQNLNATTPLSEGIKPERFQAEQQIIKTALDAPVKAENLFEEMIQRINLMKTDSQNTMTIQLNPEYLGEVALQLVSDAAGMHVRICAANSDVRAMINAQVTSLIESLEHKGIEVVEVEVTHTGIDIGAHNQAPNWERGQSGNTRYNKYGREGKPERVDFYAGLKIDIAEYYLDMGVSSVEFSA